MAPSAVKSLGVSEIEARWAVLLGLVPDDPADPGGQWHGPCPGCHRPGKLSAHPGAIRPVVWKSHCDQCAEADIYGILVSLGLPAHPPGKRDDAAQHAARPDVELAAITDQVVTLMRNRGHFSPVALGLAVLEAHGIASDIALDVLGVDKAPNRTRARKERTKGLAAIKQSRRPVRKPRGPSPAAIIQTDNTPVIQTDNEGTSARPAGIAPASENTELTRRATLVSGPGGHAHSQDTDTDTRALEVLTQALGPVEVIASGPPGNPQPFTGPCARCTSSTTRYGPLGSPLCDTCRTAPTPAPPPPVPYHRRQVLAG